MRVGLYNLEPKYKNLALEKLRIYHQQQGDEVEDYFALARYDKVYASSIFTFTDKSKVPEGAVCGGTGFDLTTKLPPEIEEIKPHLNFGFTTRGCIRNCAFCVVHAKEGWIKIVGDLLDLWDGKATFLVLMDNNALALPDHFTHNCRQAQKYHIKLDWNQGLDHRLLTPALCRLLAETPHIEYRFAFDSPASYKSVDKAIGMLKDAGINRSMWYVLVGFNTTFQEDLDRLNFLRECAQKAFVMRFNAKKSVKLDALADWVNGYVGFAAMSFDEFLRESKRGKPFRNLIKDQIPDG